MVRFSGPDLHAVALRLVEPFSGSLPIRRPVRVRLFDAAGVYDDGVAVFSPGPGSYTGEDTLELTCHGNPLIVDRLLAASSALGVRLADPGEFTRRALMNGKLDLMQAEAIDQVTRATSDAGLRIGRQGLDGALGEAMASLRGEIVALTAELEARLDHPHDELADVDDATLLEAAARVRKRCEALAATFAVGRLLVDGARVAIVGEVNAGKSSLFNALLGRSRALVHAAPGTTRDVVEARCRLGTLDVTLLDTAGERATDDPVEAAGLALGRTLVAEADLLLVVVRADAAPSATARDILARTQGRGRLVVYNGIDRPEATGCPAGWWPTCALDGRGVDALKTALAAALVARDPAGDAVVASARQRDRLLAVAAALAEGCEALVPAGVAAAADAWTRGLEHLDALTGADTRESVLDAVFARFCIGK